MAESKTYNFCTITHTPRIPEHCIAYAFLIEWDKHFPKRDYDTDSPEDIQWIYEVALARAKEFGIEGVTYTKTLGVVKNIIPNIASTNSIIAAACAHEFIKVVTYMGPTVDNYMMYMGKDGINVSALQMPIHPHCHVCQRKPVDFEVFAEDTVEALVQKIETQFKVQQVTIITESGRRVFASNPPPLFEETKGNLEKSLEGLLEEKFLTKVDLANEE